MANDRLRKLITDAGGPTLIALRLSTNGRTVTPARVNMWVSRGRVSEAFAEPLARVLRVSVASLRPDIFKRRARA